VPGRNEPVAGHPPHRIEHAQTLHSDDLPRLAALGLTASVQPMHCLDDIEVADALLDERTAGTYAFRSLLDAGYDVRLLDADIAPLSVQEITSIAASREPRAVLVGHYEREMLVSV
jgi:predicted amidohydrolase YtcJ